MLMFRCSFFVLRGSSVNVSDKVMVIVDLWGTSINVSDKVMVIAVCNQVFKKLYSEFVIIFFNWMNNHETHEVYHTQRTGRAR